MLLVFDDMIADIISHKKINQTVTGIFTEGGKPNISTVFITQSYFQLPQNFRLNSTYDFNMKISNKIELQSITFNHQSDIYFKDFRNVYNKFAAKPYFFSDW